MIAYYFPPQPGGGVQRSAKFVKYLPDFGWLPTVLTIDGTLHAHADDSLAGDITRAEVVRVRPSVLPAPFVRRRALRGALDRLLVPDSHVGWWPIALRAARRLMARRRFDVIYTSCGPFSMAGLGRRLHRRTGIPWVLDLRDLWTLNPRFRALTLTPLHRRAHAAAERAAIDACSHLVVTSASSLSAMRRRYPAIASRSDSIPNGYDPMDFGPPMRARPDNAWRFVYTGACYPPYSPEAVLRPIAEWRARSGAAVEVHYAGLHERAFLRAAAAAGLGDAVTSHGLLPHPRSIELMQSADVLLLFLPDRAEARGWVPGKLYEYLASEPPIFAVAAESDAAALIEEARAGVIVHPGAPPEAGAAALDRLWETRQRREPRVRAAVERFDRRRLTQRLAAIFDNLAARAPQRSVPQCTNR